MKNKILISLCVVLVLVIGYFLWGLPFYLLRYGVYEGSHQWSICMESRFKELPVEYVLPEPNSTNVSLHSPIYVKFKDSILNTNYMLGDRLYINDNPANFGQAQIINGVNGSLSIPYNKVHQNIDNSEKYFKNAQTLSSMMQSDNGIEEIKNYVSEDSWPSNTKITVLINRGCYKTYKLEFVTTSK